ncbi:MAG: D-sedoheptulose 7-phosphate isomerase [Candidatus Omnitrophota bacterium]
MDHGKKITDIFLDSIKAKKGFISDPANIKAVSTAADEIIKCFENGGKILVCGNGGSAADSQHLAAEFVVRFEKERKPLPCIALTADTSILTAAANDYDYNAVFKKQIEALARPGDVLIAISTSGNSGNILEGVRSARARGIPVIALTGKNGGKLLAEADILLHVRENCTARIQEIHITMIHVLCKLVEDYFCDDRKEN